MKFVALLLCLVGSTAFANLTIISSPIQGVAINGPNGLFQIQQPTFSLKQGTSSFLTADSYTAKAVCELAGKTKLVEYTGIVSNHSSENVTQFDYLGVMSNVDPSTNSYRILDTVICQ